MAATKSSSQPWAKTSCFIFDGRAPMLNGSFTSVQQYYLTDKDYRDILAECPDVGRIAPIIQRGDLHAVSEFYQSSGEVMGTTPIYNEIRYTPMGEGRWINDLDDSQSRPVIVIGDESRRILFPGRPALGSYVLLNGQRFQVIGVLQRVGHGDNMGDNTRIIMPYHTMQKDFPPLKVGETVDAISYLNYQPTTREKHAICGVRSAQSRGPQSRFRLSRSEFVRRVRYRANDGPDRKDFYRHGYVPGQRGAGDADAGRDWNHQHHAGRGGGPYPRDRTAQGSGSDQRNIMFQFFVEGAFLTLLSGCIGMGVRPVSWHCWESCRSRRDSIRLVWCP